VLAFYESAAVPIFDKKKPEQSDKTLRNIEGLRIIAEQHGDSSAWAGAMKLVDIQQKRAKS
jgi:hypothetical protein